MKNIALITGLSGAGKTTASNMLEDMGYTVIDQYPAELLPDLLKLIKDSDNPKYDKVCLTISINDLEEFLNHIKDRDDVTVIVLTCDDNTIITRYKFTRRIHPLIASNKAGDLDEAIKMERGVLEHISNERVNILDTSKLTPKRLKMALDNVLDYEKKENFTITFESFGYKKGIPEEADVIIDTRVLNNPYWVPELRDKTGNDEEVYRYVMSSDVAWKFTDSLCKFLDVYFSSYNNEEKRHLVIGIGCTGGQHRSVSIANFLYQRYKDVYNCKLIHKEMTD